MANHLAKNLEYLLAKHHLSANQLQEQSGITQSTTTRIIKGDTTNPRQNVIESYADFFKISVQELLYSELSVTTNSANAKMSNKAISVWTEDDIPPDGMIPISYYRSVRGSLGDGYSNQEDSHEEEKLWFRQQTIQYCNVNPHYAKAIVVVGDSMYPELADGQVIAIDTSATRIFDGEIYAFLKNGELKVKYLFKVGNGFKAVSRNEDKLRYPDEIYSPEEIDAENIQILGQYWWKSETRKVRR